MAIAAAKVGAAQTGRVKKVVQERGFGFITGDDGKEYFFHRSELDLGLSFDRLVGGESGPLLSSPVPKVSGRCASERCSQERADDAWSVTARSRHPFLTGGSDDRATGKDTRDDGPAIDPRQSRRRR